LLKTGGQVMKYARYHWLLLAGISRGSVLAVCR
jgi:hypothetical protein